MCSSPDEMSDARVREIIEFNQRYLAEAQALVEAGDVSYQKDIRFYQARIANFQAVLDERERQDLVAFDTIVAPILTARAPSREPALT